MHKVAHMVKQKKNVLMLDKIKYVIFPSSIEGVEHKHTLYKTKRHNTVIIIYKESLFTLILTYFLAVEVMPEAIFHS